MKQKSPREFINKTARRFVGIAGTSAGFGLVSFGSQAQAQVIINEDFSSGSQYGNNTVGATPSLTDLPGGVYGLQGSGFGDTQKVNTTNSGVDVNGVSIYGKVRNGGAISIPIGSTGSYVEPDALTISGTFAPAGADFPTTTAGAAALGYIGFYSVQGSQSNYSGPGTTTHFIGLSLSGSGDISYVVNGTSTSSGLSLGTGIFNPTTDLATLSYSAVFDPVLDEVTFSNITVNGTTHSSYVFTTGTVAATAIQNAGYAGTDANFPAGTFFTHFEVAGLVPEPSTYALLAAGAAGLGATRLRRKQQA